MDLLTTSFICWLYWACCTKHTSKNLTCKRSCKVCLKKQLKYMMFFLSTYHKQRSLKSGKAPLHRKRMNANEMYLLLCKYMQILSCNICPPAEIKLQESMLSKLPGKCERQPPWNLPRPFLCSQGSCRDDTCLEADWWSQTIHPGIT